MATVQPDRAVHLERQADRETVEERVDDQPHRPDGAGQAVPVCAVLALDRLVQPGRPLDDVQHEEADDEGDHRQRYAALGDAVQPEELGDQVEGDEPEQDAGGGTEHEVHPVPGPQRHQAAGGGREHGEDREEVGHPHSVG